MLEYYSDLEYHSVMNTLLNNIKKELIAKTAGEYFKSLGYEKTQVDRIAKELGVGVGTIYSIFGSKEGLFLGWVYTVINKAYEEIVKEAEKTGEPLERIKIFINYKLNYYEANKAIIKDYMNNNLYFLKNTARRRDNPMIKIYESVAKNLKNYFKDERDFLKLAYLLEGIINSYIEYYCEQDVDLTTKTDEILEIFLNSARGIK